MASVYRGRRRCVDHSDDIRGSSWHAWCAVSRYDGDGCRHVRPLGVRCVRVKDISTSYEPVLLLHDNAAHLSACILAGAAECVRWMLSYRIIAVVGMKLNTSLKPFSGTE